MGARRESMFCSEIEPSKNISKKEQEKRERIIIQSRRRILNVHHAHNEQFFETQRGRASSRSRTRNCVFCPDSSECSRMKRLLAHMGSCSDGERCRFHQCIPTKKILFHYKNCIDKECPICVPVRKDIHRKTVVRKYYANLSETAKCTPRKRPRESAGSLEKYAKKSKCVTFTLDSSFQK